MRVLVTGASGFMGGAVCRALAARGHEVIAAVRRPAVLPERVAMVPGPDLGPEADWAPALAGVEAVAHLAARAHVMDDREADPLAVFRRLNRDGAVRLAEQAATAGVRRLVFVSTIKVNGEATPAGQPFRPDDPPAPADAYGLAKAEAETALAAVAARTGLELAVMRPPLVHGPGAKGNLATLMTAIARGWPLPLGAVRNRRSLVGLDNLADALAFLVDTPATGTFLVRDGEDVSTPQLIGRLASAMGRPARLIAVPAPLLRLAGRLAGRSGAVDRLLGSLVVDDSALRGLGWTPRRSLDEGLAAMAAEWRQGIQ